MILTLTPNPSLDLLFRADRLAWDDANRVPLPRRRPGGQGINVVRAARALAPAGGARAIALLGGVVGDELRKRLEAEGTALRAVPVEGESRVFVGVRETETGRSLLLNPGGPGAGELEAQNLLRAVEEELEAARADGATVWVACCGSLPPGLSPDFYASVGRLARSRGHRFVPDCDGEALRLAAGAGCDLLVPNVHEAARLLGSPVTGPDDAPAAARALLDLGPELAVVTLGGDGAVAATRGGVWRATLDLPQALRAELRGGSAVGAGDALLAALLLGLAPEGGEDRSAGPDESTVTRAVADGVAAGTATLLGRGEDLLTAADFRRVRPHVSVAPA